MPTKGGTEADQEKADREVMDAISGDGDAAVVAVELDHG